MNKLLLIFTLISAFTFGQQVTSYRNGIPNENNYQLPLTFHNYLDVQQNIQKFLHDELFMTKDEDKSGYDVVKKDTIWIFHYTENGFGKKHFESLTVKFPIIKTDEGSVFTKAEITGDIDLVVKFWAFFWTTSPKFNYNSKVGLLAENNYLCDKIQLFRISNGAKISITNTCYDKNTFLKKLAEWKKEDEKNEKMIVEQQVNEDQTKVEERKIRETPKIYPKQTSEYVIIAFTKDKNGINFIKPIKYKELENEIKAEFNNDKVGNYTVYYDVFLEDGIPKKMNRKASQFKEKQTTEKKIQSLLGF